MSEGRESANFFKRTGENDRHEARAIVWGSNNTSLETTKML